MFLEMTVDVLAGDTFKHKLLGMSAFPNYTL